jgi:lipoprotein-releasing system permease protein
MLLETEFQVDLILPKTEKDGTQGAEHYGRSLIISAVYDGGDQSQDAQRLFLRRTDLVPLAKLSEPYQELRVWLTDYEAALDVKHDILERRKAASPTGESDLTVETWEEQREDFLRAVKTEKVLLVIVLSFIVLLGGFIILATLTLTVVEKTRDIGVLAALGASRAGILSIFLRNGLFIGLIGAALGLGLGALLVSNLNGIKDFFDSIGIQLFPPDIYLFTEIPTVWDWATILTILGGSVGVAFFAGLVPALRASRLDPVVALRHE